MPLRLAKGELLGEVSGAVQGGSNGTHDELTWEP